MIKRAINILNKEVRGMHDAAYLLAGFSVLSVLLALVRDKLLAYTFGAGIELDIYYAAFRIPDLIYALVASMMSVFVLVPFLSRQDSDEQRHAFIHTLLMVFGAVLILVSFVFYVLSPSIIERLFSELVLRGNGDELISLTRILLLQPIILGTSSILASVVQYYGRYFIYAMTALVYNIGIIIGVLFLVPAFGIYGLGYGVVLGAVMHLLIQLPTVLILGFIRSISFVRLVEVFRVVTVSLPRTMALSANHITLFFLVAMAGKLPVGSIAVFTLAFNLQAAPISIIGASYSTAAFPTLSKLFSKGNIELYLTQISSAARHIIFWSFPIVALVVVLRAQIVRVVYGSGSFDWSDTRLTAAALALFIISLVSQSLVLLFIRGYYAASKTIKPLIFSVVGALVTIVLAIMFIQLHSNIESWRDFLEILTRTEQAGSTTVLMLPMAYAVSSIFTAFILIISFAYDFHSADLLKRLRKSILESLVGAFVIGLTSYIGLQVISNIIIADTILNVFLQGAVAGTLGIVAGIIVLRLLGSQELDTVWRVLHHKFWRSSSVVTDTELN
jgi:putative peptidoglycan lipid II flippase